MIRSKQNPQHVGVRTHLPNQCQPRNRSGDTLQATQPSQAFHFGLTREPTVLIIGLHFGGGVGILGIVGLLLEATGI